MIQSLSVTRRVRRIYVSERELSAEAPTSHMNHADGVVNTAGSGSRIGMLGRGHRKGSKNLRTVFRNTELSWTEKPTTNTLSDRPVTPHLRVYAFEPCPSIARG